MGIASQSHISLFRYALQCNIICTCSYAHTPCILTKDAVQQQTISDIRRKEWEALAPSPYLSPGVTIRPALHSSPHVLEPAAALPPIVPLHCSVLLRSPIVPPPPCSPIYDAHRLAPEHCILLCNCLSSIAHLFHSTPPCLPLTRQGVPSCDTRSHTAGGKRPRDEKHWNCLACHIISLPYFQFQNGRGIFP